MLMDDATIKELVRKAEKNGRKEDEIKALARLNSCSEDKIMEIVKTRKKPGRRPKVTEVGEGECAVVTPEGAEVAKTDEVIPDGEETVKDPVTPHMPPAVKEAVEEKLNAICDKIKYHERALEELRQKHKEIVGYLYKEGRT